MKLPAQKEVVTSDELMAYLGKEPCRGLLSRGLPLPHGRLTEGPLLVLLAGDCILSIKPQGQAEAVQLNFQQVGQPASVAGRRIVCLALRWVSSAALGSSCAIGSQPVCGEGLSLVFF